MKVECIDDRNQNAIVSWEDNDPEEIIVGDNIHFGDIYTVVGTYQCGTANMFLLDGLKRNCKMCGDGWDQRRFRPLRRTIETTTHKEAEKVE